eukprot:CAMPEP_0117581772 /NCGR_PEP_ID=MMETSP0784-20121206/66030_1 /TAXON_ID=39447 /ORGANISM="" /LENGTH=206 /DNA_ID=CAMNT_0005382155 /DNA_START=66 /DNA_END=683 /DNA_ORIENTATION=+
MSQFASDKTRGWVAERSSTPQVKSVFVRGAGFPGSAGKVVVKPEPSIKLPVPETKRVELEKVNNTWGSSAGSGSDAFPIYRKHRNHELERLRQMDFDWEQKLEEEEFQAKREAQATHDDAVTAAKRSKRQKRKEAKKESETMRKAAAGVNKFTGDGSFLDMMTSMSEEELAAKIKEGAPSAEPVTVVQQAVITPAQMASAQNITFH